VATGAMPMGPTLMLMVCSFKGCSIAAADCWKDLKNVLYESCSQVLVYLLLPGRLCRLTMLLALVPPANQLCWCQTRLETSNQLKTHNKEDTLKASQSTRDKVNSALIQHADADHLQSPQRTDADGISVRKEHSLLL
jgi:hypothetical protein